MKYLKFMNATQLAGEVSVLAKELESTVEKIQAAIHLLEANATKARSCVEETIASERKLLESHKAYMMGQLEGVTLRKRTSLVAQLHTVCATIEQLKEALSQGDPAVLREVLIDARRVAVQPLESADLPLGGAWMEALSGPSSPRPWGVSASLPRAVEEYGDDEQQLSHKQLSADEVVTMSQPKLKGGLEDWLFRPMEHQQQDKQSVLPSRPPPEDHYCWLLKPQHGTHRTDQPALGGSLRTWLADIQRTPEAEEDSSDFEVLDAFGSAACGGDSKRKYSEWLVSSKNHTNGYDALFQPFKQHEPIEYWLYSPADKGAKAQLFEPFLRPFRPEEWLLDKMQAFYSPQAESIAVMEEVLRRLSVSSADLLGLTNSRLEEKLSPANNNDMSEAASTSLDSTIVSNTTSSSWLIEPAPEKMPTEEDEGFEFAQSVNFDTWLAKSQ